MKTRYLWARVVDNPGRYTDYAARALQCDGERHRGFIRTVVRYDHRTGAWGGTHTVDEPCDGSCAQWAIPRRGWARWMYQEGGVRPW
jgi:hypothetical protein